MINSRDIPKPGGPDPIPVDPHSGFDPGDGSAGPIRFLAGERK